MKDANVKFSREQNIGMPLQANPVQRTTAGAGALSDAYGAEASGWWDTLSRIASTAAPYVGKIASAIL